MLALFDEGEVEILLRLLRRIIQEIPAPQGRGARRTRKTSARTADSQHVTADLQDSKSA
jgi:hypothetical protein